MGSLPLKGLSTDCNFASQDHVAASGDIFLFVTTWDGIQCVEFLGAIKYPTTNKYLAPHVSCAMVEKP